MDYKSEWALQQAKTTIETNYPLVGIAERFEETLLLMERIFPQFYHGLPKFVESLKPGGRTGLLFIDRLIFPYIQRDFRVWEEQGVFYGPTID